MMDPLAAVSQMVYRSQYLEGRNRELINLCKKKDSEIQSLSAQL